MRQVGKASRYLENANLEVVNKLRALISVSVGVLGNIVATVLLAIIGLWLYFREDDSSWYVWVILFFAVVHFVLAWIGLGAWISA